MIEAPFREFVRALGARTPTPGGGAAASSTGVMGVSLLAMALRFTTGRAGNAQHEPALEAALGRLERCTERMLPMVERDMASFERVAAAYKLPHDTEDSKVVRTRAIQEALASAMVVPEELLHLSRDALAAAAGVVGQIGRSIAADFGAGVELVHAAGRSADLLVRINARYLHDREVAKATVGRAAELIDEIGQLHADLRKAIEERVA